MAIVFKQGGNSIYYALKILIITPPFFSASLKSTMSWWIITVFSVIIITIQLFELCFHEAIIKYMVGGSN